MNVERIDKIEGRRAKPGQHFLRIAGHMGPDNPAGALALLDSVELDDVKIGDDMAIVFLNGWSTLKRILPVHVGADVVGLPRPARPRHRRLTIPTWTIKRMWLAIAAYQPRPRG
ncbi:MAG: hypothetical protein ABSH08_07415 [Tepidisphaeraceae bacterium]|jgi:hypothetical protein